jgi:hypothetical protein
VWVQLLGVETVGTHAQAAVRGRITAREVSAHGGTRRLTHRRCENSTDVRTPHEHSHRGSVGVVSVNTFASAASAERFLESHPGLTGSILSIAEAVERGAAVFGGALG